MINIHLITIMNDVCIQNVQIANLHVVEIILFVNFNIRAIKTYIELKVNNIICVFL